MKFALIKDIAIQDEFSWRGKVFLTLDMEWASDESIKYVLDKICANNAKITVFCTHATSLIEEMKREPWIELGIHPNFNFLLKGDFRYGKSIDEVIGYYKQIVPESRSVRSHCLTSGALFTESFSNHSLTFECNTILPSSAAMCNKPWASFYDGIVHVPILWEDDIHCMYKCKFSMRQFLIKDDLKVFNFHPVTTVLNINSLQHYQECKQHYSDHNALLAKRNPAVGCDDLLNELLHEVK
ncbi:MAG: hypothetical protein ABIJ15_09185 [bacterium]